MPILWTLHMGPSYGGQGKMRTKLLLHACWSSIPSLFECRIGTMAFTGIMAFMYPMAVEELCALSTNASG